MSCYPQSTSRAVHLDDRKANLGGIYENAVAQELAAKGYELFYYVASPKAAGFVPDGLDDARVTSLIRCVGGAPYATASSAASLPEVAHQPCWPPDMTSTS